MGKIIGVISLKGGVGKTSIVSSLGYSLSKKGKKILLVDGNFSAPNLGIHLNVLESKKTLHEILRGEVTSSEAVIEMEDFDFLPANLFNRYKYSPLKLKDKLKYLKKKYDIILLDSSPSLNEETLAVMNASDELLVVSTPDRPTLSTTIKSVKIAKQKGTQINGLILNKVYNKKFENSLEDSEKTLDIPVMAVIPNDINFPKSVSKFKPITKTNPKSEASQELDKLASTLIGEKYKTWKYPKIRNLFRSLKPKKQDINRTIFYERVFRE
ncbi:MAG TPA: AAA family ATPase [Candidatus Nanoarchaeia archaeon]|nr:AAA family ATPase [Candidatus Nanoarchaeia archaeon]